MAERYFKIGPRLWADTRGWPQDQRELWVYILTCPHRRTEGLYLLPKGYITGDLRWSEERLTQPLAELIANGFISYDDESSVVLIRKALKWQSPANPNGVKSAIKQIEELPQTALLREFYGLAQRYCERLAEGLAERFPQQLGEPQAPTHSPSPAQTHTPEPAPDGASSELRVGKRKVGSWEEELARQVIGIFSEVFGVSLTFEGSYEPVVERIWEEPDMSGADHRRIIEAVWAAEHWWERSGAPGIAVIYSNRQQFDRAKNTAAGVGKPGGSVDPSIYDHGTEIASA